MLSHKKWQPTHTAGLTEVAPSGPSDYKWQPPHTTGDNSSLSVSVGSCLYIRTTTNFVTSLTTITSAPAAHPQLCQDWARETLPEPLVLNCRSGFSFEFVFASEPQRKFSHVSDDHAERDQS